MAPPLLDIDLLRFRESLRLKREDGKPFIYDAIRKKWLVLQPEEFVRQLWIAFLMEEARIPLSRVSIEKGLTVNELKRRYDLLVFGANYQPQLLIECKSFKLPLNAEVLQQAGAYNTQLRVPYLIITNGHQTYCSQMDFDRRASRFIEHFPDLDPV